MTFALFCLASVHVVVEDARRMRIPLISCYTGLFLAMTAAFLTKDDFRGRMSGLLVSGIVFAATYFFSHGKLGAGDVHYSLLCGFAAGLKGCLLAIMASSLAALFFFAAWAVVLKDGFLRTKVPFAPFMFLGTVIAVSATG